MEDPIAIIHPAVESRLASQADVTARAEKRAVATGSWEPAACAPTYFIPAGLFYEVMHEGNSSPGYQIQSQSYVPVLWISMYKVPLGYADITFTSTITRPPGEGDAIFHTGLDEGVYRLLGMPVYHIELNTPMQIFQTPHQRQEEM